MPRKRDNKDQMLTQIDGQIYLLSSVMQRLLASPKEAEIYVQQRLSDLQQARNKIYAQKYEDDMKKAQEEASKYVEQEMFHVEQTKEPAQIKPVKKNGG